MSELLDVPIMQGDGDLARVGAHTARPRQEPARVRALTARSRPKPARVGAHTARP